MQDKEILTLLLKLDKPWRVASFEIDAPSNRLDIYIHAVRNKTFLGLGKKEHNKEQKTYRHLPLWGLRTYLHVPVEQSIAEEKVWAPFGSLFTVEMEAFVVNILENNVSRQVAASITGLSLAEVRQISDRTGAGNYNDIQIAEGDNAHPAITVETIPAYASEKLFVIDSNGIPEKTHECWQRVIDEKIQLHNSPVALQMLLQKIRQQLARNLSEANKLKAADILRQYFVRNSSQHSHDIELLKVNTGAGSAAREFANNTLNLSSIPGPDASIWQDIIDGTTQINTKDIALQMMIERVRQSTERNAGKGNKQAAKKILHQFFIKHIARLHAEIMQLNRQGTGPELNIIDGISDIPDEGHSCWQQIMDGELSISTSNVGLQMLIERIRRVITRNNSAANRLAAKKMLRQYFIKHRVSTRNEIIQITGVSDINTESVTELNIPPVAHPGWQKIINGEVQISTNAVALKMMLKSIRLSVANNPGDAARAAAAKILRQYFLKHQSSHRTEIEQLIAA